MPRYLGVDGGGTKTAFVLVDGRGEVLATATGPSCYYFTAGIDLVERVLREGVEQLLETAGLTTADVDRAFFALPAYGEASADVPELDAAPGRVLGHGRYSCGNDMIAGWAGSLAGRDGVNVVAGTGSIAYGEWRGRGQRAGGWGEVFGDEGSGYWTAIRGLNAYSRMVDGRLPQGPLLAAMREAVGVRSDLDAIGVVIDDWAGKRDRVAALSRVVTAAAAEGDGAAQAVVEDAGRELAALAGSVRAAIGAEGERVPLSYSGGMFEDAGVRAAFAAALGEGWDLREPVHGPGVGAALYAMKQAGAPLPD
ncbi:N-acetylglucosamine kinase [Amnibacterium setariae]|uniref:N-acetylglucosamine kinase n=1 Tax=Amnibacterium setariae TaxID=2306585 RepID=A0A3A1TVD8_9MICO|nr:BadF/BadG/BcrA/BcrD ATPase family protein [Amnibacterium setariae]RIX27759.1 N-acetylglucosamine kinase [Amnibacterium setariae]